MASSYKTHNGPHEVCTDSHAAEIKAYFNRNEKKLNHDLNMSISSDTWCQQAAMCKNEETPDPKCNSFWREEMQMNSPGEHLIVNR
jgi:hypothetical protein